MVLQQPSDVASLQLTAANAVLCPSKAMGCHSDGTSYLKPKPPGQLVGPGSMFGVHGSLARGCSPRWRTVPHGYSPTQQLICRRRWS